MEPHPARLVVHVGYPKTGTTTLQRHVFPALEGVDYLGKLIPGYRYSHADLYDALDALLCAPGGAWDPQPLRTLLAGQGGDEGVTLISSEAFIHPVAVEPSICAERLKAAAPDATILITLRRQEDLLTSFFRNHGAFGAFLFVQKVEGAPLSFPLSFSDWLEFNYRNPAKNLLGLLDFDRTVSTYERLFGPDKVQVLLFEEMVQDPPAFAETLGGRLGVGGGKIRSLLQRQHENPGLSAGEFGRLARSVSGQDLAREDSFTTATSRDTPLRIDIPEQALQRIRDRFAASNARLDERRRLGLARFDYALPGAPPAPSGSEPKTWV